VLHKLGRISSRAYERHRSGAFRRVHYLDVRKPFPLAPASVDAVFLSHVLEHLDRGAGHRCVGEINRVLREGGIVRIAVPDLDVHIAEYDAADPARLLLSIYGSEDADDPHRHKWWYNQTSLLGLLRETGFREAYRCAYREGRCPDVELLDNRPRSLFVEAVK
jgi:predicted SAM-dependent methyltransferase